MRHQQLLAFQTWQVSTSLTLKIYSCLLSYEAKLKSLGFRIIFVIELYVYVDVIDHLSTMLASPLARNISCDMLLAGVAV